MTVTSLAASKGSHCREAGIKAKNEFFEQFFKGNFLLILFLLLSNLGSYLH